MFAVITFEREPQTLSWDTFLASLDSWAQIVGGFAMLGLLLWLLVYWTTRRKGAPAEPRTLTTTLFVGAFIGAATAYLCLLASYLPELLHWWREGEWVAARDKWRVVAQHALWTAAGASAIFAVILPILVDLAGVRISARRVWAIGRLSFKEAVRRKVLWVFLALLLIVLFASWFLPHKPENQVRNYVQTVSLAMAFLLLLATVLLAAFGIPDDIRHQTIHTVLTKPVQRFEIFLGRFLGYAALMTAALVVITGFSLLYVLRNIEPEAAEESLKAREPVYGSLTFQGTKDKDKGENVGREWEYRSYIIGKPRNSTDPVQYAVWSFPAVPPQLLDRPKDRLEFALDIYRTHKGVEGQGVFCTFFVESWRFDADNPVMMQKYLARKKELEDKGERDVSGRLAEELGYFELPSMEIKDYHTQFIDVPAGVFKNAAAEDKERLAQLQGRRDWPELVRRHEWPAVPLRVRVRCDSNAQFLGMAKYDLYFRLDQDDPTGRGDRWRFCANFFKGSFGLWLRLCLMLGLAVAISTYLSGVITLLTTIILYVLGFFQEFILEVALGKNAGGGPVESAMRLLKRPGGESLAAQLEESTATQVSGWADEAFRWGLRRVMNVIPDVAQYSFTDFVAEGVSIGAGQMAVSLLWLVGYLLPWAVLAYYLLKWREVASSN